MKYLIGAAIFILGVLVGKMDANAQEIEKFEINPGCMFTASRATCVVENKATYPIRCDIKVTGKNGNVPVYSHYSNIVIPSFRFNTVDLYSDGKFTSVYAHAICKKVG